MSLTTKNTNSFGKSNLEFYLVIIMLGVLLILISFILFNNNPSIEIIPNVTNFDEYLKEKESILNYRKDILSIIIATFGAWVGAGAAYFFGRENLRESANSLLQLHRQMTGAEKLSTIKVRDIPPKILNANYEETLTLKETSDKLLTNPNMWFISIKTSDQWHIINNDAIFLYIKNKLDEISKLPHNLTKSYNDLNNEVMDIKLKDAVPEIVKQGDTNKFVNNFIIAKLDDPADKVNEEMDNRGVFLAIIKDESGNLIQYFTTSDIRKALLLL